MHIYFYVKKGIKIPKEKLQFHSLSINEPTCSSIVVINVSRQFRDRTEDIQTENPTDRQSREIYEYYIVIRIEIKIKQILTSLNI